MCQVLTVRFLDGRTSILIQLVTKELQATYLYATLHYRY